MTELSVGSPGRAAPAAASEPEQLGLPGMPARLF
jgi:hypothetical protein